MKREKIEQSTVRVLVKSQFGPICKKKEVSLVLPLETKSPIPGFLSAPAPR